MRCLAAATILCLVASVTAVKLPRVLSKDVVIIGGGASGSYAAVRLRDDYGKSIALVEKQDKLGGMVNTYLDPKTGKAYDFGVKHFLDLDGAANFFDRFGIEREPVPQENVSTEYLDFSTGEPVDFKAPPADAQMAAIEKFLTIVGPWTDYIQPGYWKFPQPANIPEDFLIPFGDFLSKYGLEDAMPSMYQLTGFGLGNTSQATTMFELQAFGTYMAQSVLGKLDSYHPAKGSQVLYDAIAEDLGDDVLYSSTVIDSKRTDFGVFLTVKNHVTGQTTRINARQLLIAIELTENNTAPLDLDNNEHIILSKFTFTREYTGILNNTALTPGKSYLNIPSSSAPDHYLNLPNTPFTNAISYMGDDLFRVVIVGDDSLNEANAKAIVQKDFNTLLKAGQLGETKEQELQWVDFAVHGPMHARVSTEDVKAGFFQDLYKLQGRQSTWWTGGAFACNFQTTLWQFDETLIPKILDNLS